MVREIDLLTEAASRTQIIVEKATNQTWELEELWEAKAAGRWGEQDELMPVGEFMPACGPYPGCLQRVGATEKYDHFRLLGQTRHFLIFAPSAK